METVTKPVDPDLLNVDAGWMIQARYGPHEYCQKCGASYQLVHPGTQSRSISLYEVLSSWRDYRCAGCSRKLWNVEDHK